jgi:hypothetical protein
MVRQTYVVGRGDVVKQEVQSLVGSGTVKATTMDQVTSSTADGRQVEIIPVKLIYPQGPEWKTKNEDSCPWQLQPSSVIFKHKHWWH